MCGRFNFSNHIKVKGTKEAGVTRSFNIAPSSAIAVLNEDMKCLKLNWGFIPSWMKQAQIIPLSILPYPMLYYFSQFSQNINLLEEVLYLPHP